MSNYYEIDFLDVESQKSGDAITVRHVVDRVQRIYVVDGGFQDTGDKLVEHINKYYDSPDHIDHVVVTHPDGDHAGGLRKVIDKFEISKLWMLRPWIYADELIDRFSRFTSVDNLKRRLKEIYPNIAALEDIAEERGIQICEPFQGANIGAFKVLAPTRERYLDLVVESEKTPEATKDQGIAAEDASKNFYEMMKAKVVAFARALWGQENFSDEDTSAENEMSVVQYAHLHGHRILLTGDAGRDALSEAADYAHSVGIMLPGIDRFQVPHHGSRRNVSTEVLDRWLGERLANKPEKGSETFIAIISAAKDDEHHPRKAVVRSMIHRGAQVLKTKGANLRIPSHNAPSREGWVTAIPLDYPEEQES